MSPAGFKMLGMHHVGYMKKIREGRSSRFAVYAANGAEIVLMDLDRDAAFATVRENNMEPFSVH
ncbi:MAG: DUF1150 family protein [Pseudomonadota bacterium]|nr:DUF1150 family protein [Pseudomonadota bacterium]